MAVTLVQSQVQGSLISADLRSQVDGEKERLFVLMEQVQKKLQNKSEGRTVTTDLRCCEWDQVMQEVHQTADGWAVVSKKSSKLATHLDKIKQNAAAFENWLDLLPAGDYGSSMCGVFRLVLGAAGQSVKVEQTVFEALSEIPYTMGSARKYLDIYRDVGKEALEKMTFDLFRAIIGVLTHSMQFFGDSTIRRAYEPLLNSRHRELFESLEAIRTHMTRIREEATQLLAVRVHSKGTAISATQENSEQALHLLESIYGMLVHRNGGTGNHARRSIESQTWRPAPDGFISAMETASHDPSFQSAEETPTANPLNEARRPTRRRRYLHWLRITLMCIIDEPTVYEMSSLHRDATDTVIRRLVRMANNRRDGVIFKLLLTCHDRALGISQYFLEPGQTIDMEQEVEIDDSAESYIARLGT